jgi:hypothetical protein
MVRAVLVRTPVCENCAAVAEVHHTIVTLRGIQLHRGGPSLDSGEWFDTATKLSASPRQLDLIGDSLPQLVVTSAAVPAGTYDKVRLQFVSGGEQIDLDDDANTPRCGGGISNCLLMSDGRIEMLGFPEDQPEVLLRITPQNLPLLVVPDSISELKIRLVPQAISAVSSAIPQPRFQIVGEVSLSREPPRELAAGPYRNQYRGPHIPSSSIFS